MEKAKQLPNYLGLLVGILFLPLILAFLFVYCIYGLFLHLAIWMLWLPRGITTLIVTSDSPIWKEYMEQQVVQILRPQAFVLNWSRRRAWPRIPNLQVLSFRYFGGMREFNPLVIVFRPFRIARVFRFWKPFKDYKHGQPDSLNELTQELMEYASLRF